jgi:hypothetical protein
LLRCLGLSSARLLELLAFSSLLFGTDEQAGGEYPTPCSLGHAAGVLRSTTAANNDARGLSLRRLVQ